MVRRRPFHHSDPPVSNSLLQRVQSCSRPLESPADLDPLIQELKSAKYVLLGEASHGTHEFYRWRTEISRRLIEDHGFSFIAVEGDWPACYHVNRYVKGEDKSGGSAVETLSAFDRWPTWMWANREIVELVQWLRAHNDRHDRRRKVGFYGLDVYSLWESLYQVLSYVRQKEPSLLAAAQRAFQCFEPYGEDVQEYAAATRWGSATCESEIVDLLTQFRGQVPSYPHDDMDERFNALQNAGVLRNAERYYRTMVRGGSESWNLRDHHMADTLDQLMQHHGPDAKAIVWEHNTHIGDARFTDMADDGMVNVGQLVRQARGEEDVRLVGFGAHRGSVIAGTRWDAPLQRMTVPSARPGSWEDVLHRSCGDDRLMLLRDLRNEDELTEPRGHRAIGVVYRPHAEHLGNYVPTDLPNRYEAFLYLETSEALQPLDLPESDHVEEPETYPSGF